MLHEARRRFMNHFLGVVNADELLLFGIAGRWGSMMILTYHAQEGPFSMVFDVLFAVNSAKGIVVTLT